MWIGHNYSKNAPKYRQMLCLFVYWYSWEVQAIDDQRRFLGQGSVIYERKIKEMIPAFN